MEMGIFCHPRTVQHPNFFFFIELKIGGATRQGGTNGERKNTQDKADFIHLFYRGLCLQGLNPVNMKWNIYMDLSLYVNIYKYIYL